MLHLHLKLVMAICWGFTTMREYRHFLYQVWILQVETSYCNIILHYAETGLMRKSMIPWATPLSYFGNWKADIYKSIGIWAILPETLIHHLPELRCLAIQRGRRGVIQPLWYSDSPDWSAERKDTQTHRNRPVCFQWILKTICFLLSYQNHEFCSKRSMSGNSRLLSLHQFIFHKVMSNPTLHMMDFLSATCGSTQGQTIQGAASSWLVAQLSEFKIFISLV